MAEIDHNSHYRGKELGTITSSNINSFLAKHEVSAGKFTDIYVGDNVTIQDGTYNKVWVVAGLDTEYNRGDIALATHHISLIPQDYLITARMNATNTTKGGYAGSEMHTTTLPTIVTNLQKALGSHLLKRRVILTNSISTAADSGAGAGWVGSSNDWAWTDAYATLMSEVQVYGSSIFGSSGYDVGEACQQLPIFKFINHVRLARGKYWLRAVTRTTHFALADDIGSASFGNASHSGHGVRPLIVIG